MVYRGVEELNGLEGDLVNETSQLGEEVHERRKLV